jgi:hypothetical protein
MSAMVLTGGVFALARAEQASRVDQALDGREVTLGPTAADAPPAAADPPAVGEPLVTLLTAPATIWRPWSTTAMRTWLPATDAGPQQAQLDLLEGFARTPEGALAAAGNLCPAIYYTRDRADWDGLANRRVLWADGAREALWSALQPVWSRDTSEVILRPVGFRMLSFTPDLARVRLWWRAEPPGEVPVVVGAIATVRWFDDDWWLVFDEATSDIRPIDPGRDSYLPWGPGAGS